MSQNFKHIILSLLFAGSLLCTSSLSAQYRLAIKPVDKDSVEFLSPLKLQSLFKDRAACETYINGLTGLMLQKGFPAASIDSTVIDSLSATIWLYAGPTFKFALVNTTAANQKLLQQSGIRASDWSEKTLDAEGIRTLQDKLLDHLENNGYPFAKVSLDSISFTGDRVAARLKIDEGPEYKIDSIRVYGNVKINSNYLQRFLEIQNGSRYKRSRLDDISNRLRELPFLQEQQAWNMTMLGTGSIINLYLQQKKSSQVNVLLGLLPANEQTLNNKLLLTGEANINLRNTLGNGELIGVNWQQIQVKSPRLNLAYQQSYLFGTPFGISANFDLFKKDSSYLNLNFVLGLQYDLPGRQNGRIFFQSLRTNVLNIDTFQVKATKRLPAEIDVTTSNMGVDYEYNSTDYRLSPSKGSEVFFTLTAGIRKIDRNSIIVKMKDPSFSYADLYDTVKLKSYQFRLKLLAAHYFRVGRQSTIKTGVNAALVQSPSLFRNELFQIGGYKLLRGFDEESIFASQYAVATLEYRYLIGLNSYLFSFLDYGITRNKSNSINLSNRFTGAGLGLAFETKAGIFNISYAAGKRDDRRLNLRESKIHLGYVNFF